MTTPTPPPPEPLTLGQVQTDHDAHCRIGWPCKYGLGDPCPVTMVAPTPPDPQRCAYCRRPLAWHDGAELAECAGCVQEGYAGWDVRYRRSEYGWVWFARHPDGISAIGSGDREYATLERAKNRVVACIDRLSDE